MADENGDDTGTESVDSTPGSVEAPIEGDNSELEAAQAKIDAMTSHNQNLESELSKQKAANYDLLTAVRAESEQSGGGDSGGGDAGGDEEPSVDDLFE